MRSLIDSARRRRPGGRRGARAGVRAAASRGGGRGARAGGARAAASSQRPGVGPSSAPWRWRMLGSASFCLGCLYELVWLRSSCAVGAALTPGCRTRHARQRPLRRLPGRACLPVSGALLFLAPSLDGFCLRNACFPARCTLRERRARLSGTRGRDRMRTQTNKKFRLLMLSTPSHSGILPGSQCSESYAFDPQESIFCS